VLGNCKWRRKGLFIWPCEGKYTVVSKNNEGSTLAVSLPRYVGNPNPQSGKCLNQTEHGWAYDGGAVGGIS
jgi:hypothetical protein